MLFFCLFYSSFLFFYRLDANVLTQRVQEAKLLSTLLENTKEFVQRMQDYVYPFIEGYNHSRLICYYSLLTKSEEEHWLDEEIKPSVHVSLLKKLRPVAPGKFLSACFTIFLMILYDNK